jgi:hypothetical protein
MTLPFGHKLDRAYIEARWKRRFHERFIPVTESGCWLWTEGTSSDGYGRMGIRGRGTLNAHRIAWELYKGPIPEGMQVCHTCDVTSCVNPNHLFLGTPFDNAMDMARKGRRAPPTKGSAQPNAKLTDDLVRYIRESPKTFRVLSDELEVSMNTIYKVRARRLWGHVK